LSTQAGFVNPKAAVAKVKPSDFEEAARRVCKLNVKEAQVTYPDVQEKNIPYLCMDLVYQHTLLVDGFGMARWKSTKNAIALEAFDIFLDLFCLHYFRCGPLSRYYVSKEGALWQFICGSSMATW
jgi:hypothetical protein